MEYNIINEGNFEVLSVALNDNEQIKLETGSMLSMSSDIKLEGKRNGSMLGAIAKSALGGENFFVTRAQAHSDNQEVIVAPKGFGSIKRIDLTGTNWYLEDGVFLASSESVDFSVKRQKSITTSLVGGTGGFFILKTSGVGELFVESYGSIIERELDGSKPLIVDNNHLIGWEDTIKHEIVMASGVFGFKTGEGFSIKLTGRGKVLIQTRQPEAFYQTISPFIPTQR